MTSKKMKQLLALVVVLLACIVFYAWLSSYKIKEKNKEDKKNTVEAETIFEIDAKKIKGIKFNYQKKNYEIVYNGTKKKGVMKGKEKWPLDQELIKTMVSSISNMQSVMTIDSDDKAEYGLDKPSKKLVIATKDGEKTNTHTFLFGNEAPNAKGHYFMEDGKDNIYVVNSEIFYAFEYDITGLLEVEKVDSITPRLVYAVHMKAKDFNMKAKYDGDIKEGVGKWIITEPYSSKQVGVTSKFTEYFINYESLTYDKCVAYKPKNLSKYGLDKPKFSVEFKYYEEVAQESKEKKDKKDKDKEKNVTYKKKTFSLLIGKQVKEDYEGEEIVTGYYVMKKGGDRVYTMETASGDLLMNSPPFSFIDTTINSTEILQYSNVKIKTSDKTYTYMKKANSKIVDGEDTVEYEYKLNDKKIDAEKGNPIENALFALSYSGDIGNKKIKTDKTILTLTYKGMKGGAKDCVIKFLNYDDENYRVNKDGEELFLVSIESVDSLVDAYKKAASK